MEGPLEVKDSATTAEEPVKSEQLPQSPHSSGRSDGAASPPPNCSICLGKLINTSFTDSCLHQFCFTCLLQWSKIKTECPLCKQTFKSIIHNVRSEEDYDQYHVPPELVSQIPQSQVTATLDVNLEVDGGGNFDFGLRRFYYRTTMGAPNRRIVTLNPEQNARREPMPGTTPQSSREDHRRTRPSSSEYRRTVYLLGIWATALPDILGRFRECSAEYYRRQPNELDRLIPWLVRELKVLLNNNGPHIAYVLRIITDALTQHDIRSAQFRDLVRPFFGVRTDHFVHELLNFARTNFDLVGYDRSVIYFPQGLSNEYVPRVVSPRSSSSSSTSSSGSSTSSINSSASYDSDVRLVDEAIDLRVNTDSPSVGPHQSNMPGPSTVTQVLHLEMSYRLPDVLTISSSSSDDECQVVGYVKPRHERTPEIIELVSSDAEEIIATASNMDNVDEPSTSNSSKLTSTKPIDCNTTQIITSDSISSSESNESDDNYDLRRSRRHSKYTRSSSKKHSKDRERKRSSTTRSRNKPTRNLSSSGESDSKKRSSRRSRKNSQYGKRKRVSSSSERNVQESEKKKSNEERSKKASSSTKSTLSVRKDLIKKEGKYNDSCSSSSSSSESEDTEKDCKSHVKRKTKRRYLSSSSDGSSEMNDKQLRNKDKSSSKQSTKKSEGSKENKSSRSRSCSESSYTPEKHTRENKDDNCEYNSEDDSNVTNREQSRRKYESRSKTSEDTSNSDHDHHVRSDSQCSDRSSKSYVRHRRSKHKEKHKNKERERSGSKTSSTFQSTSSVSSTSSSSSSKTDGQSSRYSDSKNNGDYKDKYKARKSRKESKHRRSRNESKTKSKKKRRRVRSSSSSRSE